MTPDERDAAAMRPLSSRVADLNTRAANIAEQARWLAANGSTEEARTFGHTVALTCRAVRRMGMELTDAEIRDTQRDAVASVRALVNDDAEGLTVVLDHSEDTAALACASAGLAAELLLTLPVETRTAILARWTDEASRPDGEGG